MLSCMLAAGESELVCDFAETYGIHDIYALPPSRAAVLALGLKDDSRIKMKMSGGKISTETYLLAMAVDALNWLVWSNTENGAKNRKRPASVLDALLGISRTERKETAVMSFDSPEEFMAYRDQTALKGDK